MASLATEPTIVSAKDYAAQQTRKRRSSSSSFGSTNGRIGKVVAKVTESKPLEGAVARLIGCFSGTGGAVGVAIRLELRFNEADPTGSPAHIYVSLILFYDS
jgi:hypothetical protein